MNVAYEKGMDGTAMVDANAAMWADAELAGAPLADAAYDYESWFPTAQTLVTDASRSAKGCPECVGDWFALRV